MHIRNVVECVINMQVPNGNLSSKSDAPSVRRFCLSSPPIEQFFYVREIKIPRDFIHAFAQNFFF